MAHCIQKEVGQNIKDKKRVKRVRDGDPSWGGGSGKRRNFQTQGNTSGSVASFGISEGNITGRKKNKIKPTDDTPNRNSQWRSSPDTQSATNKWGPNREVQATLFRLRTRPECPGDNLRGLTGDSNPNCGIAREREKERENFPMKSSNLRHCSSRAPLLTLNVEKLLSVLLLPHSRCSFSSKVRSSSRALLEQP